MIINIRTLYNMPAVKLSNLKKNMDIRFDNGIVLKNCNYKDIIVFRYYTDFITKYNISITEDLWITNYFKNGRFSKSTYINLYSKIFRLVVKPYIKQHGNNSIMDPLFRDMYLTVDNVNKYLLPTLYTYTMDLDVYDLLSLQFDKDLITSMVEAVKDPSPVTVNHTYDVLDVVMKKPEYSNLSITLLYLTELSSVGQIRQMFASRGYVTELNGRIFKLPMTNSFLLGFKNIYEFTIETRAGTKALSMSGKNIQDAEYTNRELNIATQVLEGVHHGDCGKPVYIDTYVKPDEFDSVGNLVVKNNFEELDGKHYYCNETKTEKILDGYKDKHLIGTTIPIRTALYCSHNEKNKICSACIGEYGDIPFDYQNLGNLVVTIIMVLQSQGLLSAKHLLKTAVQATVNLTRTTKQYFMLRQNESMYVRANVLNKKTKNIYVKIRQDEAWGLDSATKVKDLFSLNIHKISRLSTVWLVSRSANGAETEIAIPLSTTSAKVFLSVPTISHIIKHGYETPDEEHYVFNIDEFNNRQPMFTFDKAEYNLASLSKEFKASIKSHKYKMVNNEIRSEVTPDVLVAEVFDLLNSKLSINIALVEMLIYCFTAKDITNQNYDLGRGARVRNVATFKQNIDFRTLGSGLDWNDTRSKVADPMSFTTVGKTSSLMDVFIKATEVVKEYSQY